LAYWSIFVGQVDAPRDPNEDDDDEQDDDRERKAMTRLWAKREEQIRDVVEATAGLYGDLQGIAGRTLLEIEGLEMPLLDGPAGSEAAE
jgi:hypothetical protein